jgi:hypothetical protein
LHLEGAVIGRQRSQFEYLYPRVLEYFAEKRAREITPDVVDAFLDHVATDRKLAPDGAVP